MTPAPQDADARAGEIAERWIQPGDPVSNLRISAGHRLHDDVENISRQIRCDIAWLRAERARLLALIPKPRPADLCTRCGLPIKGVLVGDVDGYAHQDCFYPPKQ